MFLLLMTVLLSQMIQCKAGQKKDESRSILINERKGIILDCCEFESFTWNVEYGFVAVI